VSVRAALAAWGCALALALIVLPHGLRAAPAELDCRA